MLRKIAIAATLTSAPITMLQPAFAQESEIAVVTQIDKEADIIAKLMAAFEPKNPEPIDEARLNLARITTGAILPDGTYARMMESTFDKMLAPMAALFSEITPQEVSNATGVSEDKLADLDAVKVDEISALLDPARAERGKKVFDLMIPLMTEAFTEIEPALREGMARAYARKFEATQLTELNAFFKTETGSLYASESFVLMADPEVMLATMQAMPIVMEKVFAVLPQMEEEMKSIPAAKTLSDLTDAQLATLADLLNMPKAELEANRDDMEREKAGDPAEDQNDEDNTADNTVDDGAN